MFRSIHINLDKVVSNLSSFFRRSKNCLQSLLPRVELAYLVGILPVYVYWVWLHQYLNIAARLPFLALMLVSVYCAGGVTYGWIKYYTVCLASPKQVSPRKKMS